MKFDWNVTITGIIALSAVISPIIVAIINNRYQLKLIHMQNFELAKIDSIKKFANISGSYCEHNSSRAKMDFQSALLELLIYFKINKSDFDNIYNEQNIIILKQKVDKLIIGLSKQIITK